MLYKLVGIALLVLCVWFVFGRHVHRGYGMKLVRKDDGTIWVASRLIGSPAWKCGVQQGMQVIKVDGFPMRFTSEKEFSMWSKTNPLFPDYEEKWVFNEGFVANLSPSIIWKSFDGNFNPNEPYIPGKKYCKKTGVYKPVKQVPKHAMRDFIFGTQNKSVLSVLR